MKKLLIICAMGASLSFAGCSGSSKQGTTDSASVGQDSSGQNQPGQSNDHSMDTDETPGSGAGPAGRAHMNDTLPKEDTTKHGQSSPKQ
jgi:hypothetical protein